MAVLYVEDDTDDQEIFMEVLKSVNANLHCYLATDGTAAIEMLDKIKLPVCIYVDVNMPRMNGLELLQYLKLHPEYSHIPVFVLTTSGSNNDKLNALALGAQQYIIKPNSYKEYLSILNDCCKPYIKMPV